MAPTGHTWSVFGRPPRRQLGPRYTIYSSIVAVIFAAALFIGVILWALANVD